MILERLPDVQQLSPSDKRRLAEELWDELLPRQPLTTNDDALEKLLDVRHHDYELRPDTASSWEEVRRRLNAARQCVKS